MRKAHWPVLLSVLAASVITPAVAAPRPAAAPYDIPDDFGPPVNLADLGTVIARTPDLVRKVFSPQDIKAQFMADPTQPPTESIEGHRHAEFGWDEHFISVPWYTPELQAEALAKLGPGPGVTNSTPDPDGAIVPNTDSSADTDAVSSSDSNAEMVSASVAQTCDPSSTTHQITVVLARPADVTAAYPSVSTVRTFITNYPDWMLDHGTTVFRDQDYRWTRASDGGVLVCQVDLTDDPATTDANEAVLAGDGISASEIRDGVRKHGFNGTYRKYFVFGVGVTFRATAFGVNHSTVGTTSNPNNAGNTHGVTPWGTMSNGAPGAYAATHELWHILGSVVHDAPLSCYEVDGGGTTGGTVDCGDDGGSNEAHAVQADDVMNQGYVVNGEPKDKNAGSRADDCSNPDNSNTLRDMIDCGRETYYNSLCAIDSGRCNAVWSRTLGAYYNMGTYWNIAQDSLFLTPVVTTAGVAPPCQGQAVGTSGLPYADEDHITVTLGAGSDKVNAGEGNDTMTGGDGDDYLCGGHGQDNLRGQLGLDNLGGGAGDDIIQGGYHADRLEADAGDDALYDGLGSDTVIGGDGNDVWYQCADSTSDTVSGVETVKTASSTYC